MAKLRRIRLWVGAVLVTVWAVTCLVLFVALLSTPCGGEQVECGDAAKGPFLLGVAVTPLLLVGLPLLASALPRRDPSKARGFRLCLQIACFGLAAVYALCAMVFFADLGTGGTGAELLFSILAGGAAASVWAGVRAGR